MTQKSGFDPVEENVIKFERVMWARVIRTARSGQFDKAAFADCLRFSADQAKRANKPTNVPRVALNILAEHLSGNGPRVRNGAFNASIDRDFVYNEFQILRDNGVSVESAINIISEDFGKSPETVRDWLYPRR